MLFNSLQFVFFFPLVLLFYFNLPVRWRNYFLLAASYYFYMCWKAEYIILIVISTLIDYYAGLAMSRTEDPAKRWKYLLLSMLSNLGLLFSFKYFNFFNESARAVFQHYNLFYDVPVFKLLLPVGISFYTFQTMSYTIDVYRGKTPAESHLPTFALYVSFFPQLVAGPIERSTNLLPQFYRVNSFDRQRFLSGLQQMLWGFFKKVVIADRLAILVNRVYGSPEQQGGVALLIATYFFAFQIYCDFSGYSDIAIGSARIMGFELMENFRRPYFSKSIGEFWRRWHISLSTWFRDYLYIPLGGNRVSRGRWYFNLFFTFLVSGLWHGANWTFVIWGALHGFYLLFSLWTEKARYALVSALGLLKRPGLLRFLRVVTTFHLVLFSWVFFRARNLEQALTILKKIGRFSGWDQFRRMLATPGKTEFLLGLSNGGLIIATLSILLLEVVHLLQRRGPLGERIAPRGGVWTRYAMLYTILLVIIVFGEFNNNEFIYFQF
ncbi:MBOAT family protein [bacterium]|nr:MBOAT family protein [bacterium]